MAKTKYGTMDCPTPKCGHSVTVRINEHETLSWNCDECEVPHYVKKDQEGYANFKAVIKTIEAPKDAPAPKSKNVFTP